MENKRGNVSTVFLIIAIILIVVMGALLYMQKTESDKQIAELENNASKLQETIDDLQGEFDTISNTINDSETNKEDDKNEMQYIEMTEDNHKKYNTGKNKFIYENIINNNDKTITIKGRVYEEIELPTITKVQYQDLMAEKTIDLLGHKMKVSESNDFGGHDLLIESTDDWMAFYIDKNSDGTGTLMYGSEIALYQKTNTYMKITVDESIPTEGYSLKQLVGYNALENQDSQKLRMLPVLNDCYIFENGKCTSITFSTN